MWRRYIPNTNCPSDAITRTSHAPSDGNVTGSAARTPPAFDRMLTNRTTSEGAGSAANGFSVSRRKRSRPSHSTTVASNDSFRRSEEHTSELQSLAYLVCRLLLEKKK